MHPPLLTVDIVMDRLYLEGAEPGASDWVFRAVASAHRRHLSNGRVIRIPTAGFFLACKIAASRSEDRWDGPYYNHDLEDLAFLIVGCSTLVASVVAGGPELQRYVRGWAQEMLESPGSRYSQAFWNNLPVSGSDQTLHAVLSALAGGSS